MSGKSNPSAVTPAGLDKDSLTTVNDILVDDVKRKTVWRRRRRIQQCVHNHIDDLLVEQVKDGKTIMVEPMKTFRRCGFSMGGFNSVKVKVYGDRSHVANLQRCGNAHCPYCWLDKSIEKAKKIELSINGAFGNNYSLYFVTFTKDKVLNIEDSIGASRDWMSKFTKMFQDHSRNRSLRTASYINLEFTIGTVRTRDPDWKDGNSEVFRLHAHNHACIAIHNDDMNQWKELQKKIEESYVKFMKARNIATFPKSHKMSSVHWETVTHPNNGIAHYFHKVERDLKISSEMALSQAKSGKKDKNLGLFQALDFMDDASRRNREAMGLTIARTLVAMHGSRRMTSFKSHNFVFRKDAGPNNIGKMGFEMKRKAIQTKIQQIKGPTLSFPVKSRSLWEMKEKYQAHDWSHLINKVSNAMAFPLKEQTESEIQWIQQQIREVKRFRDQNWKKIEENRILKLERQPIIDMAINHCSICARHDKKNQKMLLNEGYVQFLLDLNLYDELIQALQQLLYWVVTNVDVDWVEIPQENVDPIGEVDVHSTLWDRLYGQGKAFNLVKRIQDHVRHGAHPLLKSQMDKCVVPHHIEDYVIVESEFKKLVSGLDL